jgi:hypothetical protein
MAGRVGAQGKHEQEYTALMITYITSRSFTIGHLLTVKCSMQFTDGSVLEGYRLITNNSVAY